MLVGVLMVQGVARVDMTDFSAAMPIALTLLLTVLTNNLINGMALGTLSYILLSVALGRRGQVTGIVWALGAVFVAYFVTTARVLR